MYLMQRRTREVLVFHVPHDGDVHMNYAFLVFHYQPGGKTAQKLILTQICSFLSCDRRSGSFTGGHDTQSIATTGEDYHSCDPDPRITA